MARAEDEQAVAVVELQVLEDVVLTAALTHTIVLALTPTPCPTQARSDAG